MKQLISLLANQKTYPLELARKIGIECSIAVTEIIKFSGFAKVLESEVKLKLNQAAISDSEIVITKLHRLSVLSRSGDYIQLIEPWFEDQEDEIDLDVNITESIWTNKEFLQAFNKWKDFCVARGKGRNQEYYTEVFRGKDLESSISALRYAYDNKFTTLYFKDEPAHNRGSTQKDRGNNRRWANGRTGERASSSGTSSEEKGRAVHKGVESLE